MSNWEGWSGSVDYLRSDRPDANSGRAQTSDSDHSRSINVTGFEINVPVTLTKAGPIHSFFISFVERGPSSQ